MKPTRAKKSSKNTKSMPAVNRQQAGVDLRPIVDIPLEYSTGNPPGSGRKEIDLFIPTAGTPKKDGGHISSRYTTPDKKAFSLTKEPPPLILTARTRAEVQTFYYDPEQRTITPREEGRQRTAAAPARNADSDTARPRKTGVRPDTQSLYDEIPQIVSAQTGRITPVDTAERKTVYTEAPVRRKERPAHEAEAPVRRRERPAYEAEAPVRRRERRTYEAEAPTRRRERPAHEAEVPRPVKKKRPSQQEQRRRKAAARAAEKEAERTVYDYIDGKKSLDIPKAKERPGTAAAGLPPARETVVRPEAPGQKKRQKKNTSAKTKTIYEQPKTVTYTDIQTTIPVRKGKGQTYPAAIREERELRRKRDERLTYLIVICVVCFVAAAVWLARIYIGYRLTAGEYADLNETYVVMPPAWEDDVTEEMSDQDYYPALQINFASLYALNNDFAGWLYVPGVGISYPLVQAEDNEYYLNHTFMDTVSSGGAIFLDEGDKADFSGFNTFIYGHNMQDRSMFGSLSRFAQDETLVRDHPHFYVYLPNGSVLKYRIFSYYQDSASSDSYVRVEDMTGKQAYLAMVLAKSVRSPEGGIVTDDVITIDDTFATLSTCHGRADSGQRFLVHGYLEGVYHTE